MGATMRLLSWPLDSWLRLGSCWLWPWKRIRCLRIVSCSHLGIITCGSRHIYLRCPSGHYSSLRHLAVRTVLGPVVANRTARDKRAKHSTQALTRRIATYQSQPALANMLLQVKWRTYDILGQIKRRWCAVW